MAESLLQLANYGVLLFFGGFVSAAFSGLVLGKKNTLILSGFCVLLIVLQLIFYVWVGYDITVRLYPLITHFPLALLLVFYYHRSPSASVFAVMTAYLCCQVSKWLGLVCFWLLQELWMLYLVRIVFNVSFGFILVRFLSPLTEAVLAKPTRTVLIFSIPPAAYYVFDYISAVYTDWLYRGNPLVFEFIPFLLSVVYLMFCALYFREYEQRNELERQKQIMEIQAAQSVREIEAMRSSTYETSLLRHNIRHHLQTIYSYVESGSTKHALCYIRETLTTVDSAAVERLCANELVNLILSHYKTVMDKQGIVFDVFVAVGDTLPCSEQEFGSILSNGLENAVHAVLPLAADKKAVHLLLKEENHKLLLSIRNPYASEPVFVDGIPVPKAAGHGFGTQSIRYITQKLNGNCQFTARDGVFTLRVVL